jgi:hypothetical protein
MMKKLFLISEGINDPDKLAMCVQDDVLVCKYPVNCHVTALCQLITDSLVANGLESGHKFDNVGWVFHGFEDRKVKDMGATFSLFLEASDDELTPIIDLVTFVKEHMAQKVPRIDLLACCLYKNKLYRKMAKAVEKATGVCFAASSDITGNIDGGDWFLEGGKIDAKTLYFTDAISSYPHTLGALCAVDISATINVGNPTAPSVSGFVTQTMQCDTTSRMITPAPGLWHDAWQTTTQIMSIYDTPTRNYYSMKNINIRYVKPTSVGASWKSSFQVKLFEDGVGWKQFPYPKDTRQEANSTSIDLAYGGKLRLDIDGNGDLLLVGGWPPETRWPEADKLFGISIDVIFAAQRNQQDEPVAFTATEGSLMNPQPDGLSSGQYAFMVQKTINLSQTGGIKTIPFNINHYVGPSSGRTYYVVKDRYLKMSVYRVAEDGTDTYYGNETIMNFISEAINQQTLDNTITYSIDVGPGYTYAQLRFVIEYRSMWMP